MCSGSVPWVMPTRCQPGKIRFLWWRLLGYQNRRLEAVGVYLVRGDLLGVGEDVGVPLEGHRRVLGAEDMRDDVCRHAVVEHHHNRRVPEVVEAYPREARPLEVPAEDHHD